MKAIGMLLLVAALVACSHDGPAPRSPSHEYTAAHNACANLRLVGCPEGNGSVGGVSCETIVMRSLRPLPLACWTTAASSAEAKGCGSLRCIR